MKIKLAKSIYVLFISMSICACTGNQTNNLEKETRENTSGAKEERSEEEQIISEVVDGYLKLKDALAESDAEQVKEQAVQLLEVIDATEMPSIQQNTKEIAAADALEEQRIYFDSLSENLYQRVKEGKGIRQKLYKQYCPMAFDNRGAFWLSSSEEIKNPYLGKQMINCGNTEETIDPSD